VGYTNPSFLCTLREVQYGLNGHVIKDPPCHHVWAQIRCRDEISPIPAAGFTVSELANCFVDVGDMSALPNAILRSKNAELYGAPATVYCDSVTLIFASIIIIIIITIDNVKKVFY